MSEENQCLVEKEDRGYIELLQLHKSFVEQDAPTHSIRSKLISNPFMVPLIFLILVGILLLGMQITGYADLATIIQ